MPKENIIRQNGREMEWRKYLKYFGAICPASDEKLAKSKSFVFLKNR
jgi:hypothetical protein